MMPPLLDRNAETAALEAAWRRARVGEPRLAVVWGRRRVGKTFLLSHFAAGKRSLFFGATQQSESIELGRLAEAVRRDLGDAVADLGSGAFATWEAALRFMAALAEKEPLAVILDEVPYLARSTPGFASIVQAVWDHLRPHARLLLVLTGSAVGIIESMLGARGPLRGRPSLRLRLDPLDPTAARVFLPRLSAAAFLEAYAACGGYPLHLRAWSQDESTETNLRRLAGEPGGVLVEDAQGMLREELPESGGYGRILAAIGRGSTRYSEIAGEAGQRVEHPLDVLVRGGFVRKALPIGAPRGAKPTYELADAYLAFWFRVLYADLGLVEGGQGRAVLARARPRWQAQLGATFEDAARAHARRLVETGVLPRDLVVGRWWATSGEPCEVDVLGLDGRRTALLGEARWHKGPLGMRELRELESKVSHVPAPVAAPRLVLWGRDGVAREVIAAGAMGFGSDDVVGG